jgi:phage terminase small subunit
MSRRATGRPGSCQGEGVWRSSKSIAGTGLPSNFCAGKLKFLAKLNSVVKGFVMRRGPKPELPSVKANGGTFRPHRDRFKVEVSTSNALPIKPDWLSPAGQTIWDENVTRAAAVGVTEHDTVIFTIFCNLTGEIVQAVQAGKAVSIAAQTEVRRLGELLGLAGPRSRIVMDNPASKGTRNPFVRRPRSPNAR